MDDQAQVNVWVDADIREAMESVKRTKGLPITAQVRFALLEWLESQGYPLKAAPRAEGGAS